MWVISSASLPDELFAERYLASDQFAPEPGLLASLTYDATRLVILAVEQGKKRPEVAQSITDMAYEGLNGLIRFQNSYWADAPIHIYRYGPDGALLPVDRVIE
jgi:hypothetical protein